jgi:hypothetical protein
MKTYGCCPKCGYLDLPKSRRHEAFLHVAVAIAWDNWPVFHDFKPDHEGHLRSWLTCQTQHRTIIGEYLGAATGQEKAMKALVRTAFRLAKSDTGYIWAIPRGDSIALVAPRSWADLNRREFVPFGTEILALIRDHTGLVIRPNRDPKKEGSPCRIETV